MTLPDTEEHEMPPRWEGFVEDFYALAMRDPLLAACIKGLWRSSDRMTAAGEHIAATRILLREVPMVHCSDCMRAVELGTDGTDIRALNGWTFATRFGWHCPTCVAEGRDPTYTKET